MLGCWKLFAWNGNFSHHDARIAFLEDTCVFELPSDLGWGRFWYRYTYDTPSGILTLTPLHEPLLSLWKGASQTRSVILRRGHLRMTYDDGRYSIFLRDPQGIIPEHSDLLPRV